MLRSHLLHVQASEKEGEKIERRYRGGYGEGPVQQRRGEEGDVDVFRTRFERGEESGDEPGVRVFDDVGVAFLFQVESAYRVAIDHVAAEHDGDAGVSSARARKRREFE